jgi:hypothetical protein
MRFPICFLAAVSLLCCDSSPAPKPVVAAASKVRAARRAYDGAPPVIPHPPLSGTCTTCHGSAAVEVPGVGLAPPNPHLKTPGLSEKSRCRQCHVFTATGSTRWPPRRCLIRCSCTKTACRATPAPRPARRFSAPIPSASVACSVTCRTGRRSQSIASRMRSSIKFKARNTKSETNPKREAQKTETARLYVRFVLPSFELRISFVFRASYFVLAFEIAPPQIRQRSPAGHCPLLRVATETGRRCGSIRRGSGNDEPSRRSSFAASRC